MTGFTVAAALSAVTVALLLVLIAVWGRSYRSVRTPLALGLVLFSVVLLAENSVALYFYFLADAMFYVDEPEIATLIAVQRGLQLLAVGAFAYVSLR